MNEYFGKRKGSDIHFKLTCNLRSKTNKACKSQNSRTTNGTFDLLGCSHSLFKKCIIHQLSGDKTLENYGSVWQIGHCLDIASFNLLDEKEEKKCFNLIDLRPMFVKDKIIRGVIKMMRLYLLEEVQAKNFLNLNAQEV